MPSTSLASSVLTQSSAKVTWHHILFRLAACSAPSLQTPTPMASSSHPTFPPHPYSSTIHPGPGTRLPERGAPLSFASTTNTLAAREAARLERERLDREQRDREQRERDRERNQAQAQGLGAAGSSNPMAQLTDEQRDEVNEAFGLFDLDKDQHIDYHEFKVALKALGFDLSKPDLLSLLTTHGVPPPSYRPAPGQPSSKSIPVPPSRLLLTLPAFQAIASRLILERDPRDEILRAFALFDTEGKGMISLEDLRRVARELGEGLEEEELVAMIEEFDLDGKGGVGQEEFVGICMN